MQNVNGPDFVMAFLIISGRKMNKNFLQFSNKTWIKQTKTFFRVFLLK